MYGKGFAAMYTGSMFGAGLNVFAVWNYAINNADRKGYVELNPTFLAATLGGPVEQIVSALAYLCAPDPRSRSKVEDGRRLVKEGEYLHRLVNYEQYRTIVDETRRREYMRVKKREQRKKKPQGKRCGLTGVDSQQMSPMSTQVEVEVEGDGKVESVGSVVPKSLRTPPGKPSSASALAKVEPVEAELISWSRAACDDWIARFGGTAPGGQIGKALLPIVKRHGWEFVRKAWCRYLAQSEAQYASPQRFSATFGRWAGLSPDPPGKDDVIAHNARAMSEALNNPPDLSEIGTIVKSMPGGRR